MLNGSKSKKRVVVTGLGVVSSIGIGADAFIDSLTEGRSGASPISLFDTTGFPSHIGCEVKDFAPGHLIRKSNWREMGRSSRFSIAAARMAFSDSNLNEEKLPALRCSVSIGTTDGEAALFDVVAKTWVKQGAEHVPSWIANKISANWLSESVAKEFGIRGEALTIATACAAGNYAIGNAYDQILLDRADVAICGGADSICRKNHTGFYRIGALAPEKCQPFDKNRKGILVGEGAGCLVLESEEHALSRKARIYAEILGYGLSCDAYHIMAPQQEGIVRSIRHAHEHAGIVPGDVDYICAHGTGTPINDTTEVAAIHEVFGNSPPPTSALKSMLGHTMGAASALSAIACVAGIFKGFIPPTINYETPDPGCDIDCVPNKSRTASLKIVQNNAFAFGGNNAVVIISRY